MFLESFSVALRSYSERLINLSLVNLNLEPLMNRSKLYEWLLDNDCPWDFIVDDTWKPTESVRLTFLEKDKVETQEGKFLPNFHD